MQKLLFLILYVSACSKNQSDKAPYYEQFKGKWACINSSERIQIHVRKNGIITLTHESERGYDVNVVNSKIVDTLQRIGRKWIRYGFYNSKNYGIDLCLELENKDSLFSMNAGVSIQQGEFEVPSQYCIFRKID